MFGLKPDLCNIPLPETYFGLDDYAKNTARWCPSCGGHSILSAVHKVCREKQYAPEKTVFVSGIGCSSRFPHYMNTYGFHGLHGRALPVASGVKFRRPDLNVFVITGDGDCCSIGAGHWVHAIRYNMRMVVLLFDNSIYGLTKKQMSPTSARGTISNTSPKGSILPPLNPIQSTLGIANVSFVAQTTDWNPPHLYATIKKAAEHPGLSFVRIVQRCPIYMKDLYEAAASNPDAVTMLTHENGIELDPAVQKNFKNQIIHDPADINKGRELAELTDSIPIGLFYQNTKNECYDDYGAHNMGITNEERVNAINTLLDGFAN